MSVVLIRKSNQNSERVEKRRLIKIETAPMSEQPLRVTKRRTGVILGSFSTAEEVEAFIATYPLAHLKAKPTRRSR